jgi:hypothetical protein
MRRPLPLSPSDQMSRDAKFCLRCGSALASKLDNEQKPRLTCSEAKCGWVFYNNPVPGTCLCSLRFPSHSPFCALAFVCFPLLTLDTTRLFVLLLDSGRCDRGVLRARPQQPPEHRRSHSRAKCGVAGGLVFPTHTSPLPLLPSLPLPLAPASPRVPTTNRCVAALRVGLEL